MTQSFSLLGDKRQKGTVSSQGMNLCLPGWQVVMRKMWATRLTDQSEILTSLRKSLSTSFSYLNCNWLQNKTHLKWLVSRNAAYLQALEIIALFCSVIWNFMDGLSQCVKDNYWVSFFPSILFFLYLMINFQKHLKQREENQPWSLMHTPGFQIIAY